MKINSSIYYLLRNWIGPGPVISDFRFRLRRNVSFIDNNSLWKCLFAWFIYFYVPTSPRYRTGPNNQNDHEKINQGSFSCQLELPFFEEEHLAFEIRIFYHFRYYRMIIVFVFCSFLYASCIYFNSRCCCCCRWLFLLFFWTKSLYLLFERRNKPAVWSIQLRSIILFQTDVAVSLIRVFFLFILSVGRDWLVTWSCIFNL